MAPWIVPYSLEAADGCGRRGSNGEAWGDTPHFSVGTAGLKFGKGSVEELNWEWEFATGRAIVGNLCAFYKTLTSW